MDTSLDTLLRGILRPARYTGAEWNSGVKEWGKARLHVALVYPDLYEVGISSPRMAALYALLAQSPDVLAERAYAPAPDMAQALKAAGRPLFTLESRRPLAEFDFLLVELAGELSWTTLLTILDAGGIPVLQDQRDPQHPLVFGWGAEAPNPEPLADVLDGVLLGDAEAILPDLLQECEGGGSADRSALLRRLARVPGVYVPSLYSPHHDAGGALEGVQPLDPSIPFPLQPRFLPALPPAPTHPPVPFLEAVQDRGVLELQRGCGPSCPTYLAGLSTLPLRRRDAAATAEAVTELVRHTGYEEVSLATRCLRDYPDLEALVRLLAARARDTQTVLHIPAIPLEAVSPGLVRALLVGPRPALNLAPEPIHGPRLRGFLEGPEGVALRAALEGTEDSLAALRLPLLLGHPLEGEEDWREVAPFLRGLRRLMGRKPRLRVTVSPFIPRPHTRLQRAPQVPPEALAPRLQALRKSVSQVAGSFSAADPEAAYVEGALARGDRRVGRVLLAAWRQGSSLDTWRESFRPALWRDAFARAGLSLDLFTRERRPEKALPWGHLGLPSGADAATSGERQPPP